MHKQNDICYSYVIIYLQLSTAKRNLFMRLNTKKKIRLTLATSVFAALTIWGVHLPAQDITAEETSSIDAFTQEILDEHKAEVEAEKALQNAKCREMYENRIEDYKLQAETSLDRVAKNSQNAEKGSFIGSYQLTAYIATGNRCASGVYPTVNHTVACNSIPLGTKIYIEGYGEFVVEDTGGMAGNVIDIFVADYGSAIQFGRRTANVYVISE